MRTTGTLTDRQSRFVDALLETSSVETAAQLAGYADRTGGDAACGTVAVQEALRKRVCDRMATEGLELAVAALEAIFRDPAPPAVKLAAASFVFELNGMGAGHAEARRNRPAHEVENEALAAVIASRRPATDRAHSN